MKLSLRSKPERPLRAVPSRRFGYDRRFWGRPKGVLSPPTYWSRTRQPLPSLAFIAPILLGYEFAVARAVDGDSFRAGADQWIRQALAYVRLTDRWFPPLILVLILLAWQVSSPRLWKFPPRILIGMLVESLIFAIALIGLSKLVDLGFSRLESHPFPTLAENPSRSAASAASFAGFLGAGIYEETLFRLLLIPTLFGALKLLQTPDTAAQTLAVTASALAFSFAHHAGVPGEAFTWFAFIFRWAAGVSFAWIFLARGFGVAVGAHVLYDILVGIFAARL